MVHFDIKNKVGIITLDRPQQLNALNLEMCRLMFNKVKEWKTSPEIAAILIKSSQERAFCAGGDVKSLQSAIVSSISKKSDFQYVIDFFVFEYLNDYQLATVQKPIVSFCNGITMGGGIGIMQGTSYRVVTETTQLAMPEVGIGLYPDVGATHFLNKIPKGVGTFLGMTGARFGPHDAIELGLADYYVKADKLGSLEKRLLENQYTDDLGQNHQLVAEALNELKFPMRLRATVTSQMHLIQKLHTCQTAVEAFELLKHLATQSAWVAESFENMKKGSPLSAAVAFEQIKRGHSLSLKEAFIQEFDMSINFSCTQEFPEGVRARLVDKDNEPEWLHKNIADVSPSDIEMLFRDCLENEWSILKSLEIKTHPFKDALAHLL